MEDLLKNAKEFLDSGEDNLIKKRYNVSASDFFKAIVIFCDYLVYNEIKRLPKNHNDRFNLLKLYFKDIFENVSSLFELYVKSYNLRVEKEDVLKLREYARELEKFI